MLWDSNYTRLMSFAVGSAISIHKYNLVVVYLFSTTEGLAIFIQYKTYNVL